MVVGYFKSSVAVDATADEALAFLDDEAHLRAFVSAIEPDETFEGQDGSWFHSGSLFHHRIDWRGSHSHGYVWVIHRGDASDLVAEVTTSVDREGLDQRLDAALFAAQDTIETLQRAPDVPRPQDSASFVVEEVLKGLARHLPVDHRRELDPYLVRAPDLDGSPEKEAERAARCRAWADALGVAGRQGLGRQATGFVEHVHHVLERADEDLVTGEGAAEPAVVAGLDPTAMPDGFRQELDETYEAVSEAVHLAAHRGWAVVDWKGLLDQLFAI